MSQLKKPVPFGKYYLLERINVGGMAEVFKAKAFGVEGFERLLAVKRILPNIAEDKEFISMFIDEAKIAVQLQHGNIAQIFDLGKVEESYFIALEFVHGRDLRSIFDRMRNKGESLPIALACYVVMQVCEGLDYAHNKRDGQGRELHLVHRDISPQNVLIGYEGEVKLIDFGIAKAAGKASTTQAGILKGKFGYMSPEQVRGLPIDKRSDIFAVGIVLYELLTGERLFVGETDFSTLEKVRNVEIVPPSSYNKKIPKELERLMLKALARDPEDRYQNAIDLHDDLQSFLYSIGEFYSRKDLAAWMKKTFAIEIEEDNAKLEEFRQVAPPVAAAGEGSRRAAAGGGTGRTSPSSLRPPPGAPGKSAMGWDEEELDTQIFDKEVTEENTAENPPADLFFEDEDRTVANEPPPEVLEQARPPEHLATPRPRLVTNKPAPRAEEPINLTPPPGSARNRPPPRRPTLTGIPAPTPLPRVHTPPPPVLPPPPAAPITGARLRRSSLNLNPPPPNLPYGRPPATVPPPSAPAPALPPPARLPTGPVRPLAFPPPANAPAPFGSGNFADELPQKKRSGRGGAFVAAAILLLAAGGGGYWYWTSQNKPGRLEVTVAPPDAVVLIDNAKIGDHSPVSIERPPGPFTLSVTREGYVRSDQNVELRPGQVLPLNLALEPSPDTGFELTSEPPGGLVWLDGAPIKGAAGQQARTDFRAFRIAPGHHVLEIKGEAKFKPWRQEVDVEPGAIAKLHAMLLPAAGAAPASGNKAPPAPAPKPEVAQAPAPAPPEAPPAPALAPPPPAAQAAPAPHVAAMPPASPAAPVTSVADATAGHRTGSGSSGSGSHRKKPRATGSDDDGAAAGAADGDKVASAKPASEGGSGGDCTITVNSVPWSEVWIDGKNTTKHTPFVDYKLPCGKHRLAFKRTDMQIDYSENITIRPGEKFKQRYSLATDSE